ncbi:stress responsive A/B barrel domain protein [Aspergillus ambiguus]|uniref:Dabb family protein n=1 Tax=Aspergillus ambiguus TaxID=176160 RepID=UPI003CCD2194
MTVIHIVMFKFRPELTKENKNSIIGCLKNMKKLDSVKGHRLVVGGPPINASPERSKGFEVTLLSLHENRDEFENYRDSKEHQEITCESIFPYTEDLLRFDFEVAAEDEYMWKFDD